MGALYRNPVYLSTLFSAVILFAVALGVASDNVEVFDAEKTDSDEFSKSHENFHSDLDVFGPLPHPNPRWSKWSGEQYMAGLGPKEFYQKLPSSSVNLSELKSSRHLENSEALAPRLAPPRQWEVFGDVTEEERRKEHAHGAERIESETKDDDFLPERSELPNPAEVEEEQKKIEPEEESFGHHWDFRNWVRDAGSLFDSILGTATNKAEVAEKKAMEEDGLMEELFVAEEVFPEEYQESDDPILSRGRRAAIFSSSDFVNFNLTLVGSLTAGQRTSGSEANTRLQAELETVLKTYLDSQFANYDFTVTIDSSVDITTGIVITGEITFGVADMTLTCKQIGLSLLRLAWGNGISVFGITLDVQFPELGYQSKPLQAAVCYLCQAYETCTQMANLTWYCGFEDSRFYPFGTAQGDLKLNKALGQTAARLAVNGNFPFGSELYGTIWLSLYGTISMGRSIFDSFSVQDLPVAGRDLIAVYWSHWVHSPLGEVYYQLYTKTGINTDLEQAVFDRANSDVRDYGFKVFDATTVVVVTWDRVLSFYAETDVERASFQGVIITDGAETYVLFTYGQGALQVVNRPGNLISVGWGSGNNAVLDTQTAYFMFDRVSGDTGKLGKWFFKIGERDNPAAKCFNWFNMNSRFLRAITRVNRRANPRGCPCSRRLARRRPNWIQVVGQPNCFDVLPRPGVTWGRRCCYRGNALDNQIPTAGSFQFYSPFAGDIQAHLRVDVLPKIWCCDQSEYCNLYYVLRPRSACRRRNLASSFCWGDPHMVTVDSKSFTFNNLGEFTFLNANGVTAENVTVDVVTQARTCRPRATANSGNLTDATVWCAFALRSTRGNMVQITTHEASNGDFYMVIFANQRDYTAAFRGDVFEEQTEDVFLFKDNSTNALQIATSDGVSFTVSLQGAVMEFAVEIEPELETLTSGLMGNYNKDPSDDFIFPNGTTLPENSTDREIYEYVKTWAITQDSSVFTYERGLSTADFSDPNFVPLFLDEVSNSDRQAAEKICNSTNFACVFDYIATRNAQLANRSSIAVQDFEENVKEDSNSAPVLSGPDTLNATLGGRYTLTYDVSDAENQTVNVAFQEEDRSTYNLTVMQDGKVEIEYVPQGTNVSLIKFPTIVAVDSDNLETITSIGIIQCSGCSNRGECDFTNSREIISPYASVASCVCETPYTGDDCENDKDGCESAPCPRLTTCSDVSAEEEARTGQAYSCSACPVGYVSQDGACADVDECLNNSTCPAASVCSNAIGSYTCTCIDGYRKDDAGICQDIDECVELRHECQQTCVNTAGSYGCSCSAGFTLDTLGFNCTKDLVDPCPEEDSPCEYGCEVQNGTATCICERGFQLRADGSTCENYDECQFNLCAQTCTDTVGSYVCGCLPGFRLADDKHDCDICPENRYGKDCASQCDCRGRASACDNVRGCQCYDGWTGQNCEQNVNECELQANLCPSDRKCVDTNGSYVCECPTGYQAASNSDNCTDIDECADRLLSQCPQTCVNNPGSFACTCRDGYTYNSVNNTCDDIDECSAALSSCQQECVNVMGSYNCQCFPGYLLNEDRTTCRQGTTDPCANSATTCGYGCTVLNNTQVCFCQEGFQLQSDGVTCQDVDECESSTTNLCTDSCTNTNGSYTCSCPVGKKLDNDQRTCVVCDAFHWGQNCANQCDCNPLGTRTCDPTSGCKCESGWTGDKCETDIKECDANTNPCPAQSTCTETPGSYICTCNAGFQLQANNTCTDINECDSFPCDQTCQNTQGGFICSCAAGFSLANETECLDIDECDSPETNPCEQRCRNLIGGFHCDCRAGYTLDLSNRRNCTDKDECANTLDHTCSIYELCSNSPGSFSCACKPGYVQSGNTCAEATGSSSAILTLSISLDIPKASSKILDSSTPEFRQMEERVSSTLLQQGQAEVGDTLQSVVVVKFTNGSFIADTRFSLAQAPDSEALAATSSRLTLALSTADVTSIAPGASVLGVSVGAYQVGDNSSRCSVFNSLYQCNDGFQCNQTTLACSPIPEVPDEDDGSDDEALIIGLSVGIPAFFLVAIAIGILVYVYTRNKKRTDHDASSQASGHRSFESGIAPKWGPSKHMQYDPFSFRDSVSSRSGSTTSGNLGQGRPGPSQDKPSRDQFQSPWLAKGAGASAFAPGREEDDTPRDRPARPNTNSNFSWEYMFRLLEPHVPLEIQRPQVYPQQAQGEGSGENSSGDA